MYTRLTAVGCHDERDWCTRTATAVLASEVSATSPSIPAVLRPVLRCVTCRTLTSVFDRLRSISFFRFLTFGQSPSEQCLKPVDDLGSRTLPRKPNQESSRPAWQPGSGR